MSVAETDRPMSWSFPQPVAEDALAEGFRIGDLTVAHLRGADATCEVYVMAHADGSTCMARVARRSAMAEDPGLAGSMLASAQRLVGLRHPNLPAVLACGWTDEPSPRPYVLLERLVGRDLEGYQAHHERLEPALLLAVGAQCAAALAALHARGLAHGDLHRGCTMLVAVGDSFRIVLGGLEHARALRGAGDEARVAADLLALGTMLAALAAAVDEVPPALTGLIARMTAAEPSRRPTRAAEVKEAIAAIRAEVDPAGSVIAPQMSGAAPRVMAAAMSRVMMPVVQAVAPRRVGRASWLMLAVAVLGAGSGALALELGGHAPRPVLAAQEIEIAEEPALELTAPRTLPDRVAAPQAVALAGSIAAQVEVAERPTLPRSRKVMTIEEEAELAPMLTTPTRRRGRAQLDGLGLLPTDAPKAASDAPFLATSP